MAREQKPAVRTRENPRRAGASIEASNPEAEIGRAAIRPLIQVFGGRTACGVFSWKPWWPRAARATWPVHDPWHHVFCSNSMFWIRNILIYVSKTKIHKWYGRNDIVQVDGIS